MREGRGEHGWVSRTCACNAARSASVTGEYHVTALPATENRLGERPLGAKRTSSASTAASACSHRGVVVKGVGTSTCERDRRTVYAVVRPGKTVTHRSNSS
jgi:hypothetical protein